MNTSVACRRRRHGIFQWMPVLLAASFCLTVAVSAQAVTVTKTFRYDGTYYPDNPGAGQDSWTTIVDGPTNSITPNSPVAGVALFDDSDTGGGEYIMVRKNEFDADFAADPTLFEWEYRFTMSVNSVVLKTNNYGLRQEAGVSGQKMIMFAHAWDGNLFYVNSSFGRLGDFLHHYNDPGGSLIDGESHTYRVVKDVVDAENISVKFYLDNVLVDTRPYSDFPSRDETLGFCLASSSSDGTANWEVDDVYFGPVSTGEPIPGDANLDDIVNDADASILAAHWQQSGAEIGWGDGDFDGNNIVNDADASILAAHWQESQEGAAAVPEPSTVVLLLLSGLMAPVLWRRKSVL